MTRGEADLIVQRLGHEATPVSCTREEYEGEVRKALQDWAGTWIDQGQDVRAIMALEEVRRLDSKYPGDYPDPVEYPEANPPRPGRPGDREGDPGEGVPGLGQGTGPSRVMSVGWGGGVHDGKVETAGDFEGTRAAILETIRRRSAIAGPRDETRTPKGSSRESAPS